MSMFVPGMRCPLCEKTMCAEDDVVSFAPIIENCEDELFFANDATFHRKCLEKHPLFQLLEKRNNIYMSIARLPFKKRCECVFCHKAVTHPDDYEPLGFFTYDPVSPLYALNYRGYHRTCLQPGIFPKEIIVALKAIQETKEIAPGKIADLLARTTAPKAEEANQ